MNKLIDALASTEWVQAQAQADFFLASADLASVLQEWATKPVPAGGDPVSWQQQQCAHVLEELARFHMRHGGREVAMLLAKLSMSLDGLTRGEHNPLLLPQPFPNRPPDRGDVCFVRAMAASGIEYLLHSGMRMAEATKVAAGEAPNLDRARGTYRTSEAPTDLADSLFSWRNKFKKRKHKKSSPVAQMYYDGHERQAAAIDKPELLRQLGLTILRKAEQEAVNLALDCR